MDPLRSITPGEPFAPSAATHNALVEAARAFREQMGAGNKAGRALGGGEKSGTRILVKNDSGAARDRFAALAINAPILTPTDNADEFARRATAVGVLPDLSAGHLGAWCVLDEPLAAGQIGKAFVGGTFPCIIYVESGKEDLDRCDLRDGEATLELNAHGAGRVVWRESGVGAVKAIVRMGDEGARRAFFQVTAAVHAGLTGAGDQLDSLLAPISPAVNVDLYPGAGFGAYAFPAMIVEAVELLADGTKAWHVVSGGTTQIAGTLAESGEAGDEVDVVTAAGPTIPATLLSGGETGADVLCEWSPTEQKWYALSGVEILTDEGVEYSADADDAGRKKVRLDFDGLAEATVLDPEEDFLAVYDSSENVHRKVRGKYLPDRFAACQVWSWCKEDPEDDEEEPDWILLYDGSGAENCESPALETPCPPSTPGNDLGEIRIICPDCGAVKPPSELQCQENPNLCVVCAPVTTCEHCPAAAARYAVAKHPNGTVPAYPPLCDISGDHVFSYVSGCIWETAPLGEHEGSNYKLRWTRTSTGGSITFVKTVGDPIDEIHDRHWDFTDDEDYENSPCVCAARVELDGSGGGSGLLGQMCLVPLESPTVKVEALDATATEAGPTTGTFRFTRDTLDGTPFNFDTTIQFVVSGTATSGADFTPIGTTAVIAAGTNTVDKTVTPIDDALVEGPETVTATIQPDPTYCLELTDPPGQTATATVTIADDETGTGDAVECEGYSGLYNTGRLVGDGGTCDVDAAWEFTSPLTAGLARIPASIPFWNANDATSQWISPSCDATSLSNPETPLGMYDFSTGFTRAGAPVDLHGRLRCDDDLVSVKANGVDTGIAPIVGGSGAWHNFTIPADKLITGLNDVVFRVEETDPGSGGDGNSPVGLRVEWLCGGGGSSVGECESPSLYEDGSGTTGDIDSQAPTISTAMVNWSNGGGTVEKATDKVVFSAVGPNGCFTDGGAANFEAYYRFTTAELEYGMGGSGTIATLACRMDSGDFSTGFVITLAGRTDNELQLIDHTMTVRDSEPFVVEEAAEYELRITANGSAVSATINKVGDPTTATVSFTCPANLTSTFINPFFYLDDSSEDIQTPAFFSELRICPIEEE